MERPPSQLENIRPSGLKPPSRLPGMSSTSAGRTLLETSQSDLNAKSSSTMGTMAPPATVGLGQKHKIPGLPEPPTKRKTLAERAGEPLNPLRSHMPQPAKSTLPRSDGVFHSSSASRLQSDTAPFGNNWRNTSTASTATSTSTMRPPSRQQNGARYLGSQPSSGPSSRTAVEEDVDTGVMGKRKGTPILSFGSTIGISLRKTRPAQGPQNGLRSQQSVPCLRSLSASTCNSDSSNSTTSSQHTVRHTSTTSTSSSQQGDTNGQRQPSLVAAMAGLSLTPKQAPRKTSRFRSASKHRPSLSPVKELTSPSKIPKFSCTPSVRHIQSSKARLQTPSPLKQKSSTNGLRTPAPSPSKRRGEELPVFLTKEKLTPSSVPAWDTKGRLEDMECLYAQLRTQFASAADSKNALEESLELYKMRGAYAIHELTLENKELSSTKKELSSDLERARKDLHTTSSDLRQAKRDHDRDIQDAERKHDRDLADLAAKQEAETKRLERELERIAETGQRQLDDARREWEKKNDSQTAELTTQHWDEMEELKAGHLREVLRLQGEIDELQRAGESRASESAGEVQDLRDHIARLQAHVESLEATRKALRSQIAASEARVATLEHEKQALIQKTHFLEGNQEAQSEEFTSMRAQLEAAKASEEAVIEKLRKEEMVRRKLNAQILELKGNIRVFVRTRPLINGEEDPSKVDFPDKDELDGGKEMVVTGPKQLTATGKERIEKHNYTFDRVFLPATPNQQVFEECRELIQSVIDGYNVSILSYGQTGSGKTYGMSGPDGIIPSSIALLLSEMQRLREKGWEYVVEASFVEVYNETLNDLLGDAKTWDDANNEDLNASVRGKKKDKHEIHHDPVTGKTTVTNLSHVTLWPPPENDASWPPADPTSSTDDDRPTSYTENAVNTLLTTAAKNRRVAATKSNERSSRSHSIFILNLHGSCAATNESSEGVLNLVDLAGSERLKASGAEGSRMKETQAINKSLSSLGDVIAALGNKKGDGGGEHVPFRNSKLTYLLQSSLGGVAPNGKSSRTLMLLHLSPLAAHWQESRSSLLFGGKVSGAHIGSAKKR